jgi:CDGSH-type Zn-finger protein/truncated hemoglobin YjbI
VTAPSTTIAFSAALRDAHNGAKRLLREIEDAIARATGGDGREDLPGVARRLRRSVVRPLTNALASGSAASSDAEAPRDTGIGESVGAPAEPGGGPASSDSAALPVRIWELALQVTRLRLEAEAPIDVQEAAAALQDLACAAASDIGPDAVAQRLAELEELERSLPEAILPMPGGPLLLTNLNRLTNWLGEPLPVRPQLALCRCGASAIKPLCDGSHVDIGFTDAKDPKRVPDRLDTYAGQQIDVTDNRGTCAHSGFCTDRLPGVYRVDGEPFVAPTGGRMDDIVRAVRACPSGALGFAMSGGDGRNLADQVRERAVEVSKDGPYRITGGIPVIDADGEPVPRNQGASEEHYSLCRCGHSRNKPFCSGMHWYVEFADPEIGAEPTLFEWAGGLPALARMTQLFYEKHVPADPILSPLFAAIEPDLAQRTAKWLAEAFGGPPFYTDEHGGAPRMLAQHDGKGVTEEQRGRWVSLMEQSADEAGLPSDPEFRSAFTGYLEWASRAAMKGSRPGVVPQDDLPVPRWTWGPAGSPAVSDSTPSSRGATSDLKLPAPHEPVSFDEHIKALFREKDRESMRFALDLGAYSDVCANANEILDRVRSGSMPCDNSWPAEWVELFERWISTGMRESQSSPLASPATPPVAGTSTAVAAAESDDTLEAIQGRLGRALALRGKAPVEEPAIVIEHREPLIYMLCAAAELEHALMCEYLFAAFSLKRSVDEGLTEEQLAAVERWRSTILLVAKQEMLHLAINCNLVTSLGASPHLSRPNLPQPAKHYPAGVRLALLPFSETALRHFLFLERPEGLDIDDAEGLDAVDCAVPLMGEDEIAPHLQEFATVGHLYRAIEAGFRHLSETMGEDRLFLGPGEAQAHGELFGWKELAPITSCDDAVRAIEAIVEQGEGPRGDWKHAHFGRFLSILNEYLEMIEANPGLEVTRPVLPVLVRAPETGEQADLITDPVTARVADLCNVGYEVLLQLLYRLLCHVDESDDQIKILADVSVQMMFDVIEPLAEILTTLPVGPEYPGKTAGPTFELFYQPDYLLPHRRAAWLLMSEHLADAAVLAAREGERDERFVPVATALDTHAKALAENAV